MAELDIRDELDLIKANEQTNGVDGEPVSFIKNGWTIYKTANGRKTARAVLTYDLTFTDVAEFINPTSGLATNVILSQFLEEILPVDVFTQDPETVTALWRDNGGFNNKILFQDITHTFPHNNTTGKHVAMIWLIDQATQPTSLSVEWVVSGY